jgi:hypothetical protein
MDCLALTPDAAFVRADRLQHLLCPHPHWWQNPAWVRFAALAAVRIPGDADALAARIRATADALRKIHGWGNWSHAPLCDLVAAQLAARGEGPERAADLAAEYDRARLVLRAEHLPHGGVFEAMAIVLLGEGAPGGTVLTRLVQRQHDIYRAMKRHHWWLTGAHDLPACAVLALLPRQPEEIAGELVALEQVLRRARIARGAHLEAALHLLPLAEAGVDAVAERFAELERAIRQTRIAAGPIGYEAVAMLCLLDLEPGLVVNTALVALKRLEAIEPVLCEEAMLDLAADLTVSALASQDRRLRGQGAAGEPGRYRALCARQRAAATLLACHGSTALDLITA